jgi:hypothetical protein
MYVECMKKVIYPSQIFKIFFCLNICNIHFFHITFHRFSFLDDQIVWYLLNILLIEI